MPRLCLLLLLLTVPTFAQSGPSEDMPEVLFLDKTDEYPTWVRADRVLDAKGNVDSTLFQQAYVDLLEKLFSTHPGGKSCMGVDEKYVREGADRVVTFEETVHGADWIFSGKITGKAGGFSQDQPGTLLRVEPTRVLHGPRDRNYPHYIFLPAGDFSVGTMNFCVTDVLYTAVPEVDDQVLLMVRLDWFTRGEILWGLSDHRLFILGASEGARFSPRVKFGDKWLSPDTFDPLATAEALLEGGVDEQ